MRRQMDEFEYLEFVAEADRDIRRPSDPPKRRQPKIIRHSSRRQRTADSQTPNLTRAMYVPESAWNQTPLADDDFVGTREVGPGDVNNSATTWRTGKATGESPTGYAKTAKRGRKPAGEKSFEELLAEYE
jgi:hypothetical protein